MLLVEGTLWPLVVVGTVSDSAPRDVVMTVDEGRLWSAGGLLIALIVSGSGGHAKSRQRELFGWLARHRRQLWRGAVRVAFVMEDDTLRNCADNWLDFAAARLCRGEVRTFGALKPALVWLARPLAEASLLSER